MTEEEMGGWHHRLNGHEFEQALRVGGGQGGCSPWGRRELDMTEQLNNRCGLWFLNQATGNGTMASQPADHQGSPHEILEAV